MKIEFNTQIKLPKKKMHEPPAPNAHGSLQNREWKDIKIWRTRTLCCQHTKLRIGKIFNMIHFVYIFVGIGRSEIQLMSNLRSVGIHLLSMQMLSENHSLTFLLTSIYEIIDPTYISLMFHLSYRGVYARTGDRVEGLY